MERNFSFFLFCVLMWISSAHAQGLTCDVGATLSIANNPVTYDFWNRSLSCPTTGPVQRCLRWEGNLQALGAITANLIVGFCVNDTLCNDTCSNLSNRVITEAEGSGLSVAGITVSTITISITTCDFECCDTNDCNRNSIATLRLPSAGSDSTYISDKAITTSVLFLCFHFLFLHSFQQAFN